jgi:hypothetical protein
LKPDGTVLVAEVRSPDTFEDFLDPALREQGLRLYTQSLRMCLPSSMSERGGAALGTCGLNEPTARALATAAGFTHFRPVDFTPSMVPVALYELRL